MFSNSRTDHVGSLLRPERLKDAFRRFAFKQISIEDLRAAEDTAIREVVRFIPLDQLALSPQCGFASGIGGNLLSEDEQWRKLEVMMETAKQVWGLTPAGFPLP